MDVDELIGSAWSAVEKAGVPEAAQGVALKEAIDFLRGEGEAHSEKPQRKRPSVGKPRGRRGGKKAADSQPPEELPDDDSFFSQLADESGVDEAVLRDVFQLKGAVIHVIPPTRKLGDSKADQSRQLIALVAGAYAHGLDRSPVDAAAVRDEAKRKRCFDSPNFAAILKSMKGFNPGSHRNEIAVGSRWLDEFEDAIKTVSGDDEKE